MVKAEDIWEMEADRSIHRDNEVNLIINQIREFIEIILIFRTFLEYWLLKKKHPLAFDIFAVSDDDDFDWFGYALSS